MKSNKNNVPATLKKSKNPIKTTKYEKRGIYKSAVLVKDKEKIRLEASYIYENGKAKYKLSIENGNGKKTTIKDYDDEKELLEAYERKINELVNEKGYKIISSKYLSRSFSYYGSSNAPFIEWFDDFDF